jgi:hypothetical protein
MSDIIIEGTVEEFEDYHIPVVKIKGLDDGDEESTQELASTLAEMTHTFLTKAISELAAKEGVEL